MSKFGFGKSEEKKTEEKMDSVKDLQQAALETAKLCLHSKPFKKVLEEYKSAERSTINILLGLTKDEHDIMKFGYAAKDLLSTLAHIKSMIDVVHEKSGEVHDGV